MNNEKKIDPVLKKLIKVNIGHQLLISRFTSRKELTISIPKIDSLTEEDIKSIVDEELEEDYEIIFSQSIHRTSSNDVILITVKKV